jgi:hypothetical protein
MKIIFQLTRTTLLPLVLSAAYSSPVISADDGTGLKISAAVDTAGSFKANKESDANDRFDVREAEILLYAPVDHVFDGLMSAAAHREGGVSMFEVHEAYIGSTKLIPRSRFRLGQFFLGVGRLNRFHRHEWPFIFAPNVQQKFFGEEGALDSGVEYSFLAPLPFFLEITTGVTNGWTYGHSHNEGEKPRQPTHYGRIATYFSLPAEGGAQTGLNFLSRTTSKGDRMSLTGIDLVAKWRQGGVLTFLLQGEVWQRNLRPKNADEEKSIGAYLLPQYAVSSSLQVGVLLDYYTVLSMKDITGEKIENSDSRISPTITYKASEFSSLRLAYEWSVAKQGNSPEKNSQSVQTQATFMIGAHPAHDF